RLRQVGGRLDPARVGKQRPGSAHRQLDQKDEQWEDDDGEDCAEEAQHEPDEPEQRIAVLVEHGREVPPRRHPISVCPDDPFAAVGVANAPGRYSHSIVPGGFDVRSSATRFTAGISLMTRLEIVSSRSYGRRAQSAVMASSDVT